MKFSKAVEGFIIARLSDGYSPNTIDSYSWALNILKDFSGNPEIDEISSDDLRNFFFYLRTEYKPNRPGGDKSPLSRSSLNSIWRAIRSFYNWASAELHIERPDNNLSSPKAKPKAISPYSKEDIRNLIRACEYTASADTSRRNTFSMTRPTAKRDRALVLLLLDSGLRVSEVGRIKVEDLNLETGEIFVRPYGSGRKTKSRHVYLGKATRQAVWLYLAERVDIQPDDPLFLTKDSRPMNRHNIRLLLNRLGQRANIMNCHPHRFRHTFAIQYLRNGGEVFTLQRLLGHSSLEMVKHYLAIANTDVATAHRKASPVDRWYL